MKKASIPMALVAALMCAASAWAQPDRGRVQVQNGTVVADDGMPLRGNAYEGGGPSEFQIGRDEYNFNCFRYCANTTPPTSDDLATYDAFVDMCSQYGFYVIIDYHSEQIPVQSDWTGFWQVIAPRYANRTHVLYEMANEYGPGWWPSNYGPSDIQWQQNAYQLIRSLAPNTHIITNSFANTDSTMIGIAQQQAQGPNAVDYSNASVGFHPYGFDPNAILALKAQFPVFSTEGPWPPGSTLAWLEANGISWQIMDGPSDIVSQLASGNWAITWGQDPNTSDGTGPNNAPPPPPVVPVPPPSTPPPPPGPPPPNPSPFMPQPGANYTLTNVNSGLALDVQYSGTASGTTVWQYTPNGTNAQIWQIGTFSDGTYFLMNPNSGLCLGVSNDSTAAGSPLVISAPDGSGAHAWAIGQWTSGPGAGTYYLINPQSGLYLGVQNDSTSVGALAVISAPDGSGAQGWTIVDPPGPGAASPSQAGAQAAGTPPGNSGGKAACGLTGLETVLILGLLALRKRQA